VKQDSFDEYVLMRHVGVDDRLQEEVPDADYRCELLQTAGPVMKDLLSSSSNTSNLNLRRNFYSSKLLKISKFSKKSTLLPVLMVASINFSSYSRKVVDHMSK
jgi:hypothetical protein